MDQILDSPQLRRTLDLDQPVGLLLIAIMHFVPDSDDPYALANRLLDALPSGSYLALSHLTGDFAPEAWEAVAAIYRRTGVTMQVRPKPQIERFFDGLDLVEPGCGCCRTGGPTSARPGPGSAPATWRSRSTAAWPARADLPRTR